DGGDLHRKFPELLGKVVHRSIAFYSRAERHNHFFGTIVFHPFFQRFDIQLVRSDSVKRRKDTSEYVVQTIVLLRTFYSDYIPKVLYHTYLFLLSAAVVANAAYLRIRHIMAFFAKSDFQAHFRKRFGKLYHLLLG